MTIPRLPGIGDEIAALLPQLGSQIATAINPNYEADTALRQNLAANPQLFQQMANMLAANPDALTQLGMKQTNAAMQGAQPDLQFQIQQLVKGQLPGLMNDQRAVEELVGGQLGIQTGAQRKAEDLGLQHQGNQVVVSGAAARVAPAEADAKMQELELQKKREALRPRIDSQLAKFKGNVYQAVKSGTLQADEMDAVTNLESYKTRFERDRDDAWRTEDIEWRRRVHNDNMQMQRDELAQRKQGTRMTFEEYQERSNMDLAEHIAKSRGLTDGKSIYTYLSASPEQKSAPEFAEARAAVESYQKGITQKEIATANQQFRLETAPIFARLNDKKQRRSMSRADVDALVAQVNEASAKHYSMIYETVPQYDYKKRDRHAAFEFTQDTEIIQVTKPRKWGEVDAQQQQGTQQQAAPAQDTSGSMTLDTSKPAAGSDPWKDAFQNNRAAYDARLNRLSPAEQAKVKKHVGDTR